MVQARANGVAARPSRILIADDEHLVATGLRRQLIDLGYPVVGPATDGAHAVELARSERPDLAILDIRMPGTDGLHAGHIISKQFGIPVMMLSAFADPEYVAECNRFEVYGYLLKPVTTDQLHVAIEIAWGRWLNAREQREDIERLKTRLEDRKIIEQAKWLLVQKKGITEPDAMRLLQRQARNNRRTLVDVARSLVETDELLAHSPEDE